MNCYGFNVNAFGVNQTNSPQKNEAFLRMLNTRLLAISTRKRYADQALISCMGLAWLAASNEERFAETICSLTRWWSVMENSEMQTECLCQTQGGLELYSVPFENFYKPLSDNPTSEDIELTRQNRSPEFLTARLRELVPLVRMLEFRIASVSDSETVGEVPLLASTMNQNGTHQASVFYIMSDYIAGTAVYAGLAGTYAIGLHDRGSGQPIQLWLKANAVKHLKPGTGLIRGRAGLKPEQASELRDRLLEKGRCEVQMHVDILQGDDLIATAEPVIGVYEYNPRCVDTKLDVFQRENIKLSAKLI